MLDVKGVEEKMKTNGEDSPSFQFRRKIIVEHGVVEHSVLSAQHDIRIHTF